MTPQQAYENLKDRFAKMSKLGEAASLLHKDAETAMPSGGGEARVEQITALHTAAYDYISDPKTGEWLDRAEADLPKFPPEDARNIALMRRRWTHETALPPDLAKKYAEVGARGELLHTQHYKSGDWSKMKDWYKHSFDTAREVGEAKKSKLGVASAYEALVDSYSPGITVALIEREFKNLDTHLRPMIQEALELQKKAPAPVALSGTFAPAEQMMLNTATAKAIGFDFTRGRLDGIKGHPSSGGGSDDNRITTRCEPDTFLPSLFASAHEVGHALYEQNLPRALRYQPVGESLGMAIHESQSMIMELQACMTPEFFGWLSAQSQKTFGRNGDPSLSADNLRRLVCRVEPSFIRVDADEMTYPMHVILRFELEKAIIEGRLDVKDLPQAWNDGMKKKLGIVPAGNEKGCMQDVHWPIGSQGYFPAYTLGGMGAAQFFAAANKARPDIKSEIARGNFTPLREWLRDNVHGKGSTVPADRLFIDATGEKLNARYYLDHLSTRYLGRPWSPSKPPSSKP
jgi:carboxypeptidase Taq